MMKTKSFALLCMLILVSQMLLANCEDQKERPKERQNTEKNRKSQKGSRQQNEKGQNSKGGKASLKGRFATKDNSECSWAVSEVGAVTLKVECKKDESSFWCEFSGNPSTCPQFAANHVAYWKQISRSLKKQKNICQDPKSVLKSKVCKKGPQTAHLTLVSSSLVPQKEEKTHQDKEVFQTSAPAIGTEKKPETAFDDCVEDIDYVDQRKVAEEYCPETLLSVCNFFISMIQDKKC
ncbi:fibroblast growth factor-binding protein 1 [Alligator mississippiensis]|uniref:fibroblast growth factor-binding protein 1 n=1 Tax=Alligator mississippiensis TaxID=8496 RepID=UPI0003D0FE02|nr:fibroblast growth factor-binding protein 1 [Alligator mississippiensis]